MKRLFAIIFLIFSMSYAGTTYLVAGEVNALGYSTITASVEGGNGIIAPSGTFDVPEGSNQVFNFFPSTCFEVATITVDGTLITPVQNPYLFTNIQPGSHTVVVTFKEKIFTGNATAGVGGTISPADVDAEYICGKEASYVITPDADYEIESVTKNGIVLPAPYTFTVDANFTVVATFKLKDVPVLDSFNIITSEVKDEDYWGTVYPLGTTKVEDGSITNIIIALPPTGRVDSIYKDGVKDATVPVPQSFYSVTVSGADVEVVFYFANPTGIDEMPMPELSVYPNPTNGKVSLDAGNYQISKIEVMNTLGNVVMIIDNPTDILDLTALNKGNYFLRFYTENGYTNRHIIRN